ncbi:DCHS2 isoform 3 [Pan troglodytes]|uniref:DCHS2 isoform 3 n=1 Tax=Pan troglodytes TaxID=9598 RepID=A0A2J8MUR4_PANTR|nr:DCHS2 isoform 3 [Pan troglodytes]
MGEGRQQRRAPVGKLLLLPGRRDTPHGRSGSSGARTQRSLLWLLVHVWLWAASGSSAQLFNLTLSVDEGLPPDTLVGDIRAGLPAAQQQEGSGFFLSEDSDDSPLLDDFHVHPDTGIIRTARRLDRERRDHYSFVAATLLGAVVQVEIRVNDVNDHSPRFPLDSLQLDVSELSPPGTAFRLPGAHDPDAGLFSTQGYTLVQPSDLPKDPAGPFFQLRYRTPGPLPSPLLPGSSSPLEPLDLVLLRRLDREEAAAHRLQIEAWDGGRPRRTGLLSVELRVLDENDNPPVFEQDEYRAAVREDAQPGAEVCRVRATDRDLGPNGFVRYSVRARQVPGAGSGGGALGDAAYFAVEELSGVVRVRRPLDREAQAWHQLVVEARDGGAEPEVATVRVSIAVLDVNDNRPAIHVLFLTEGGVARVSEGARPGDYVARVSVSDADGDWEKEDEATGELGVGLGDGSISLSLEGGEGDFALLPGGPPGVFFLCVEGPLDRESRDLYELLLVATDAGSPPLSTEETLLLRVADLNDQPPLFSQQHYKASVSEAAAPGTVVMWVSASDADEAGSDHAWLRYTVVQLSAPCNLGSLQSKMVHTAECGPSFAIDSESGAISTIRTLDREVQEAVELKVVAQDLGEPPLSATCLVSITVDDVNDNEPIFWRQVYNATIAEHAPVGHCFLQVTASDADSGLYGFIEYSLYDGFLSYEAPQAFRIDPHDGQICVSQDIDRERDPATYDLLVKAKDGGGLSAQAFVRVDLEDVNDNHPVFNPSTYVTSISDETQPGTEIINVLATDQDSGIYGTVAYELIPGDLSSLFTIDSTTGIIYLTSPLSHLESTTLSLMVSAQDGGGLTAVINADVTIHIFQTTLAPAEFERPKYTFLVYEDVPEDSPIGTVKAREPLNSSEPIFYRISSGDLGGKFSIHPRLGTIRTRKPLDHETQPVVVLTVQAQLGSAPACSSTEVNITVMDVNDNHPAFLRTSDEIRISQTTPPGTALYLARAEDRDSGRNGLIRYSIASPQPGVFAIDRALGVLFLNGSLGAGEQRELTLTLRAEDQGVHPQAALLVLTVVIEKREHSPSWTFEHLVYQVEVSESLSPMTRILQTQAHPLGPQRAASPLRYSLEPSVDSAIFGIRPYTGWIYLRRQFDCESTQTYNFRVFAWIPEDGFLQNVSTTVIVRVWDENDNSPTFLHDVLFLTVEESPVPQGVIGKITAIDMDSGKNGQLLYFLLSDGKFFKMNPNTGELINWVALDREHRGHHQMTVLVTDRGSPPRNATMAVYVSVTDINDNRPFFPQCLPGKELHVKVLEGQPVNMLVTTVFAKDPDEGNNAEVTYSVSSEDSSDHFKIDANSGEIRTTTILSYDYRPSYRMTVIATDQGVPPLQGQAVVNIQVIPLSKGRAIMSQNIRHLVIPENLKPTKIMSLIKSSDHLQQHYNGKLHFSIVADDKDGHFEIDSSTGDLFLSKELDYEMTSHYLFRVITTDHSKNLSLSSTVFLSIDVEDQNDHSPSFQDELIVISVEENVPIGTLVYVFNAKDDDGSFLNSRIQYYIESHNPGTNPFLIHPSFGTLVTVSPLDRESIPTVILTVTASDQAVNVTDRRLRSLTAQIVILDVNDHNPTFMSFPIAHVKEDVTVGSLVHHITAHDPDEGRNGKVTYSILSGNENMTFMLDESSGLLTTTCPLDYEMKTQHILTVLALDDGTPALSSSQTLTVTVLDVNDEAPVFKQHLYEASVKENQNPGEFVTRVEALDRDSGVNSKLQFEIMPGASFESFKINSDTGEVVTTTILDREIQEVFTLRDGNTDECFAINEMSGELSTTRALDREQISNFTLAILCSDLGDPPRSSVIHLQVRVLDANDHSPSFPTLYYQSSVREDAEVGTVVLVLSAVDKDEGLNGQTEYFLTDEASGAFTIDPMSGTLKTSNTLDREARSQHTFSAVARDCSIQGSRSTTVIIKVYVTDVNDNDPVLEQNPFDVFLFPQSPTNQTTVIVRADDLDLGPNGTVVFSFAETQSMFSIDKYTGEIQFQQNPSSEYFPIWLQLKVTDQGIPARTTTGLLVIHMEGEDVKISFSHHLYKGLVTENCEADSLPGVIVTHVSVHDVDLNSAFIFSFAKESNPGTKFAIDQNTGVVVLVKTLDFEEMTEYELLIQISDSVHHTEGALVVRVLDVNDNPPVFSQDFYQVTVPESIPVGYSVLTLSATDLESNENISYRILSSSKEFSIDPKNGTIFTISPVLLLDTISTTQFLVEASDGGNPDLRALILVEIGIQDMNNYAPEFTVKSYNLSLSEDALVGSTLVTFSNIDHDWTRENTYVEYSIISGNSQNNFHVETNFFHSEYPYKQVGYLVLLHSLDREASASHELVILASDSGCPPLSSTAVISIQVLDVNDNPPNFSSLSYHTHVKESTPLGSHITVVSANDRDTGSHAEIIYNIISGNEKGHFYLEENTGVLYLIKPLDYEEMTKFTLTVQASDAEKKHFSFAVVFVNVLDDNDHAPQFMFSSFSCIVPENLPISSTICSINALDFDAGPYGELTYSIVSPCFLTHGMSYDHDLFLIDPLTGDIHAKQILDYENGNKYCLTVQAKDKGDATASLVVWVDIEGIDEFEPIFTQDQYFFTLPEKNKDRQLIGRVEASDADAGIDGVILYSLGTSSPFFSVNKTNGNIYLIRALPLIKSQLNKEDTMEMKIIAHSPKSDSKFASCTVFVNVSFSSEGTPLAVFTSSFSISLVVSFLVFLILICILIVMILRHKQKDTINNYEEKKTSSLDMDLRVTRDASVLKAFQKTDDCSNEVVPVDATPEWLSLISIMEKDIVNLYRHSNSSGHCSVEGETAEDKEIQRINEHPYRKGSDSALSDRESRVPDSGIPRDSDQLSCLSGETDVMVTAETAEASQTFGEGDQGEGCSTTCAQNNVLPQTVQKREAKESILADVRKESVFISSDQEVRCAALSTQTTSDHDGKGNYHWNYLLSWEPKFQPLASVFNDIAKLKDEHLHMPGIPKEKKSFVFPPPLITAVAQPGIKAVPPRMPAVNLGQVPPKHPRSPIPYHLGSLPEAMTPSFSPSLSLLTMQPPALSPLLTEGELLGTHISGTCHELKAEDEVQI